MPKQVNYNYLESDLIDKYIRVNKKEIESFKEGTIGITELSSVDGIFALVGTTIGDESKAIYQYLFTKNTWTEDTACQWVDVAEKTGEIISKADNGESIITKIVDLLNSLMDKVAPDESLAVDMYADLKEIKGVEIFQTGKWNGDMYSLDDLKEMVNSFEPLKATLQPFVKLGHNEKQPLLAKDGLPAAGWIENVYIQGNKLLADIKDMPATIYELVKNKAYKRISSEIYWNLKDSSGKVFKRALKAIALLGGDTPAVGSLADVQALYSKRVVSDLEGDLKTAEIEYFTKEDIMDIEKLKAEYAEKKAEYDAQLTAKDEEIKVLTESKTGLDAKVAKYELDTVRVAVETKVDDLISKKKVLPAQKQYMVDSLMKEVDVKVFSEKKEEAFSDSPLVKLFEEGADVVDTDEKTTNEEKKSEDVKEEEKAKEVKEATSYEEAKKVYNKKGVE